MDPRRLSGRFADEPLADEPSDAIASAGSLALRDAAMRLQTRLTDAWVGRVDNADRARKCLRIVVQMLEGAEPPDLTRLTAPDLLLTAHVLQELRSELLEVWSRPASRPASVDDLLGEMRRLETLQAQLLRGTRQNSIFELFSSIRGPELMVELAHDLRSPLTSILFLSETLRNGQSGELNDLQHRQLGIVYSAALSLVSLVGDVIELTRGEQTLVETEPAPFFVSHTLDAIEDLIRPMLEEKGLSLLKRLPARDQRLGSPLALNRVLLNLTTNAVKFTDSGFVELTVRDLGDDLLEFSVRDSGNGIAPGAVDHLFEPFHISPTRNRVGFSGTGLGLSICRRLVAAMGGELKFDSAPGWGTRFFFVLRVPAVAAS